MSSWVTRTAPWRKAVPTQSEAVSPPPPSVPAWAITTAGAPSDGDAAFRAGAALGALDTLARAQPFWAGAWRQRLALRCAAASMRLAGRAEDAAGLRDAWHLRPPGSDPGPAGAVFGAWRQLAGQPPAASPDRLEKILDQLGLHWDGDALADLCTQIEKLVVSHRSAPFDAAAIAAEVVAMRPDSELFACGWPTWYWRNAWAGSGPCRSPVGMMDQTAGNRNTCGDRHF
ncbi:DUF1403 family protein [Mesorhizobium sp. ISC15]|uniref:DUF1403 family protein n=1 Tax=Mesorhizobium sp. ISC15 TaxID=3076429 RepID=UPI00301C6626